MQSDRDTLTAAFAMLTPDERQLLTCALAGNHPDQLAHLRMEVLRGLARADGGSRRRQDAASSGATMREAARRTFSRG
jgi:hypothetical protein